jgi:hypothetical protein
MGTYKYFVRKGNPIKLRQCEKTGHIAAQSINSKHVSYI